MAFLEHRISYTFKRSDFNQSGHIDPGAISTAFQTSANSMMSGVGFGFHDLIDKGMIWIIAKQRYRIYESLKPDIEYTVATPPHKRKGISYQRDYYIYDGDKLKASGISLWCVLDYEKRTFVKEHFDLVGEFTDIQPIPEGFARLSPSTAGTEVYTHTVDASDIDWNGHTNNCRYTSMIGAIPGRPDIRDLSINFVTETFIGDVISLRSEAFENGTKINAVLPDGRVVFTALIS